MRPAIHQTLYRYRTLTAQYRLLPDFIIIGAHKGGTTSLYNYLIAHPCIAPALRKEVHFFDENFGKGTIWYRAHFPSLVSKYYATRVRRQKFITGEATPYYIWHPVVPQRLSQTLPRAKLIAVLRNPVDRAYSQYHHQVRCGDETLSFEDALAGEAEILARDTEKILQNDYYSFKHYSYLSRGIYIGQLEAWGRFFSREQMLVLKSEELAADPQATVRQVWEFLELPAWELKKPREDHKADYPEMSTNTRKRLIEFFRPHNKRLYEFLGVNFRWDP
ncbi:MAG: sulfotransferase domain-containing protein [Anaerolineae bacterium]